MNTRTCRSPGLWQGNHQQLDSPGLWPLPRLQWGPSQVSATELVLVLMKSVDLIKNWGEKFVKFFSNFCQGSRYILHRKSYSPPPPTFEIMFSSFHLADKILEFLLYHFSVNQPEFWLILFLLKSLGNTYYAYHLSFPFFSYIFIIP